MRIIPTTESERNHVSTTLTNLLIMNQDCCDDCTGFYEALLVNTEIPREANEGVWLENPDHVRWFFEELKNVQDFDRGEGPYFKG